MHYGYSFSNHITAAHQLYHYFCHKGCCTICMMSSSDVQLHNSLLLSLHHFSKIVTVNCFLFESLTWPIGEGNQCATVKLLSTGANTISISSTCRSLHAYLFYTPSMMPTQCDAQAECVLTPTKQFDFSESNKSTDEQARRITHFKSIPSTDTYGVVLK